MACVLLLGTLGWAAGPALPALAAGIDTVSVCDESHLQSAIANAAAGDTVTFSCSGTIALYNNPGLGEFQISSTLTVDGSGRQVSISGSGTTAAFVVGQNATLTLKNLTFTDGLGETSSACIGCTNFDTGGVITNEGGTVNVVNSTFSGNRYTGIVGGGVILNYLGTLNVTNSTFSGNISGASGGAILNGAGTLNVTNSTFNGNAATNRGAGGGIDNEGGTATISNSTFNDNTATDFALGLGGGVANSGGTMHVTNSTLSGNKAVAGGALANRSGTVTVTNSTISGNSAYQWGSGILTGEMSGIYLAGGGTTTLINTVLANEPITGSLFGYNSGGNCVTNGTLTDGGGNLDDDGTCGVTQVSTSSLKLSSLGNNGGPTETIALQSGSAAIAQAPCLQSTDQRGYIRPVPGKAKCDSGAYESGATPPPTAAKWYSDGTKDPGFLQQAAVATAISEKDCPGLSTATGDFNHDGLADVLVYCPSTGAYQKLYGTPGTGPTFTAQPLQYVNNASGAWTNVQMVAADFNGDSATDILVYRTDNGAYAKWFSDGGVDPGFRVQATAYVGNASGAWTNIRMVAADFNGDRKSDILVYRTDTGAYAKWFSGGTVDAGFTYEPTKYVGNAPSAWTHVQMLSGYFNYDGDTDILVYRTDTGAFAKWFSDGTVDAGFTYEPTQYVGGAPSAWTNVHMITDDFNDDHVTDILVYRPDTGAFQKWYSASSGSSATFTYEPTEYAVFPSGVSGNVQMVAADFNGDVFGDLLVYTDTGAFAKWFSDGKVDPGFTYESLQYAGGAAGAWTNVQMVPIDYNGDGRSDLLVNHT
jgi:hypothetical protein